MQQATAFNINRIAIKPISLSKAKFARSLALRPNSGDGTFCVEQDGQTGTIHYGLFHNGFLVGSVTLVKEELDGKLGFARICALSVAPNFQNNGVGKLLLQAIVERARNHKDSLRGVWLTCSSRQVLYFINRGFSTVGPLCTDDVFGATQKMLMLFSGDWVVV